MFKWLKKKDPKASEAWGEVLPINEPHSIELTRANLNLLPVNWDLDDEPKSKEYWMECKNLNENTTLHNEIELIIKAQVEHIAMNCADNRSADISRGSINGLCLLKERLQQFENEYKQTLLVPEVVDQSKVVE